jgi:hypothetical protein
MSLSSDSFLVHSCLLHLNPWASPLFCTHNAPPQIPLSRTITSSAPLLYITSFPSASKLTVALEIVKILGKDKPILLNSHTVITPVNAKNPRSHPDYQKKRKAERERQLEPYVKNAEFKDRVVIFTTGK